MARYGRHPPACTCVDCCQRRLSSNRHRVRWSSFVALVKGVLLIGVIVAIVVSFSGVQPLAGYKDALVAFTKPYIACVVSKSEAAPVVLAKEALRAAPIAPATDAADYAARFNNYRISQGRAPLEFTDELNRLASLRLTELHTDFSHRSAGGHTPNIGENIIKNVSGNADALNWWQGSPGHNFNLLYVSYKYSGYACDDRYAVQLFSEFPVVNGQVQLPPGYYFPK